MLIHHGSSNLSTMLLYQFMSLGEITSLKQFNLPTTTTLEHGPLLNTKAQKKKKTKSSETFQIRMYENFCQHFQLGLPPL